MIYEWCQFLCMVTSHFIRLFNNAYLNWGFISSGGMSFSWSSTSSTMSLPQVFIWEHLYLWIKMCHHSEKLLRGILIIRCKSKYNQVRDCTSSAFQYPWGSTLRRGAEFCNKIQFNENERCVLWLSVFSTSLHSPCGCFFPLPAAASHELRKRSVNFNLLPLIIWLKNTLPGLVYGSAHVHFDS